VDDALRTHEKDGPDSIPEETLIGDASREPIPKLYLKSRDRNDNLRFELLSSAKDKEGDEEE
jgi:hypothetical protein